MSDANITSAWFCNSDMALNHDKSKAILLGTRQLSHHYSNLTTVDVAGYLIMSSSLVLP